MNATSILNADMATISTWLRDFWRWWVGELSALVTLPAFMARTPVAPTALFDAQGDLVVRAPNGETKPAAVSEVRRADLALPAGLCLERAVTLPAMGAADLRGYLELEGERFFPLPNAQLLRDAIVIEPSHGGGPQRVALGAVRREAVDRLVTEAEKAGIVPLRIAVVDPMYPDRLRYDFAPALRAEGRLPRLGAQRQIWWTIVAALALLNVALLVWRDQQSVDRLQAMVDAQQPGVGVYRALAGRNARAEALVRRTLERRARQRPLDDLAVVTAALPDSAWVQRYSWDGRALQLAGYYQGDADPLAALRRVPRLSGARAAGAEVQADIPIGRPFDISVDLMGRSR